MDKIIEFPSQAIRDRSLLEKTIKQVLSTTDVDEETNDAITKRLLSICDLYKTEFRPSASFSFPHGISEEDIKSFTSSLDKFSQSFSEQVQGFLISLLVERLQTEIKLYFAEHGP